ncbi:hypothetical protein M5K25_015198 [Dendrobium thyrsiflorum]|uniref:Uncharacterized protein n=1 Tax=Dendrobium thyrsiflorum TaxID=117978 RepID=A0ABD0UQC2_DENTH
MVSFRIGHSWGITKLEVREVRPAKEEGFEILKFTFWRMADNTLILCCVEQSLAQFKKHLKFLDRAVHHKHLKFKK